MKEQVIIRLPPTTPERKKVYLRAAGAAGKPLADWIFETCDAKAAESEGSTVIKMAPNSNSEPDANRV
jgi:hypothetical protein